MALILRRAALRGSRAAVTTMLASEPGLYQWALAACAGLAARRLGPVGLRKGRAGAARSTQNPFGLFAFRPQFVPSEGPVLLWTAALALPQIIVETVLYLSLAALGGRASAWFRRPACAVGSRRSAAR